MKAREIRSVDAVQFVMNGRCGVAGGIQHRILALRPIMGCVAARWISGFLPLAGMHFRSVKSSGSQFTNDVPSQPFPFLPAERYESFPTQVLGAGSW